MGRKPKPKRQQKLANRKLMELIGECMDKCINKSEKSVNEIMTHYKDVWAQYCFKTDRMRQAGKWTLTHYPKEFVETLFKSSRWINRKIK